MKNFSKKLFVLVVMNVFLFSSVGFAEINYTGDFAAMSDNTTTVFTDRRAREIEIDDLLVMGDSYAVVFSYYNNKAFNYIVHPGYSLERIYNELVPLYKGNYKYVYLLIGGNDFMLQTSIYDFKNRLQSIIDVFKSSGAQVILSSYLDPDYTFKESVGFKTFATPCADYDAVVKKLIASNKLLYIDISDLKTQFGYGENDFIHPSEEFCKQLKKRVLNVINTDTLNKANPNYNNSFNVNLAVEFNKYNELIENLNKKYFPEDAY